MRIALFSDIHGNLTGLQAVLGAITAYGGADLVIAAGDPIGGESATDAIIDLLLVHQGPAMRPKRHRIVTWRPCSTPPTCC